jgi:hypothetical protein
MQLVKRWTDLLELLSTPENKRKGTDMMEELEKFLSDLGVTTTRSRQGEHKYDLVMSETNTCRSSAQSNVTRDMIAGLATEEDIEDLRRLYQDLFQSSSERALVELPDPNSLMFDDAIPSDMDLGVEYEVKLDSKTLWTRLGFEGGIPFQFNSHRHKTGALAWDNLSMFSDANSSDLEKLQLHWHQLCAVHAIVRKTFTDQASSDGCTGLLIADEVGLGKTAVSIAVIAFLNHARRLSIGGSALPHILSA